MKSLLAQEVDPRNALLSIDIETVDSVTALDQEKRYITCTVAVYLEGCVINTPSPLTYMYTLLQRPLPV